MSIPDPAAIKGLTGPEVEQRIRTGQTNVDAAPPAQNLRNILFRNIFSLFNLVNVILAVLVLLCGSPKNALFMGVVLTNALVGTIQELRAKKITDRLTLLAQGKVRLIRGGEPVTKEKTDIVQDDLIDLQPGDQIPVDGVLLWGQAEINEAQLTGEADPLAKKEGDKLFSGSFVVSGRLIMQATAVGMQAYAARIAQQAKHYKPPVTQIGKTLNLIFKLVMILIPVLGTVLYAKQRMGGAEISESMVATVASLVGMIPSGLVLLSTVVLCVGALRLGKKRALVREYACIETLARVDVVCLDKTGTLTQGSMEALSPIPFPGVSVEEAEALTSRFVWSDTDTNPTIKSLRARFPGSAEPVCAKIDFSSARKYSAIGFSDITLLLGAAEILTPQLSDSMAAVLQECYQRGQRVVVLASTHIQPPWDALPPLKPIAFLVLEDKLRPEAAALLKEFRDNGVEIKLISGDAPAAVAAIASRAGLISKGEQDMSRLPEEMEEAVCESTTVFGRVTPDQKSRLIKALQKNHTVCMVGDGINDVPALHQADCAVAMAQGSEAACQVAKIVLLDSDFSAMHSVLMEGRRAINNMERSSTLYLGKTVYTLLLTLFLLFTPGLYPFQPIQLTIINIFTIGLPSLILGLEPNREKVTGSFLKNVARSALPAAFVILFNILACLAFSFALHMSTAQTSTLSVCAAGCAGLIVLFHTSRPLDILRSCLFIAMTMGFILSIMLLPALLSLVSLPLSALLFLAATSAFSFALLYCIYR